MIEQRAQQPIRDAERIERIRTSAAARVQVVLYSAGLARVIHRDFNIVSAKMFLARAQKITALSAAVRELERSCVQAELGVERFRADYGVQLTPRSFDLRVVSPFANRFLRAVLRLDAINSLLVAAETRAAIDRRTRTAILRPCMGVLFEVKRIALDLPRRDSAPASADEADTALAASA